MIYNIESIVFNLTIRDKKTGWHELRPGYNFNSKFLSQNSLLIFSEAVKLPLSYFEAHQAIQDYPPE